MDRSKFDVRVGIIDIDSYDMIFYSNYVRYNTRAAVQFFGEADVAAHTRLTGQHLRLTGIEVIKYLKPVRWTDAVHIETACVSRSAHTVTLFHQWISEGRLMNRGIFSYQWHDPSAAVVELPPFIQQQALPAVPPKRRMLVDFLRRDAVPTIDMNHIPEQQLDVCLYPDMFDATGQVSMRTLLDYMERGRTELVGGQLSLARLKREEHTMIVVSSIDAMTRFPVDCTVADTLTVRSCCETLTENRSFLVRQRVSCGDALLSQAWLRMFFVDHRSGQVCAPPARLKTHLERGRRP